MNNLNLPVFSTLDPKTIESALDKILAENRARIAKLLAQSTPYCWNDFVLTLQELDDELDKLWSPVSHLHSVKQSSEWREVYRTCLAKITDYSVEFEQNEKIFRAFQNLIPNPPHKDFSAAQKKVIRDQLLDFHLAGVDLPTEKKQRYAEIQSRLSELKTQYEEHLLDASESWTKHVTDQEILQGIPEHTLRLAQAAAQKKNLSGWLLTLEHPCYLSVMGYAVNRDLRAEVYTAYVTRASDQGLSAGKYDNSKVMFEILALRHELGQLLGFKNYVEFSLARKMVKQPQEVISFLQQLANRAHVKAQHEFNELCDFAHQTDGLDKLEAWDVYYYGEQLQHRRYGINDEILRPYFPVHHVLSGLFTLTECLYGVQITEMRGVDVWHPDVRFFEIHDHDNQLRGQFYLDLYARPQKREGAWMDNARDRWRLRDNTIQTPIAFLTCNLTPGGDSPALLTHDEVLTLFHEFGHGLHHMLTQVKYAAISGINGVEWDAVELPSQFMECFLWKKEVLNFVSGHYQTGESLPAQLLQQLCEAKNFHAGMQLVRQIEFALFDIRVHLEFDPAQGYEQIQRILDEVRAQVAVVPAPAFNRFQHGFSHIFAGGYAAGYYSYLWAEMLSTDAFSKFEENGVLDSATGKSFLHNILEQGGSKDALELFTAFRGRPPKIDALLQHRGIDT